MLMGKYRVCALLDEIMPNPLEASSRRSDLSRKTALDA